MRKWTGPSSAPDAQLYSTPVIYNATFIGAGADGGSQVMKFRENTGGIYANSIFTGFEKGVDVDTGGKDGATIVSGQDSEARFTAGDLALKANIYHDIAGASDIAGIVAIGDSDGANADFKSNFTSALTSAGSTFEDLNWQVSPEWKECVLTPALPRTVPHTPALLHCQPMMFSTAQSPTRVRSVQLTGLDLGPRSVPATLVVSPLFKF